MYASGGAIWIVSRRLGRLGSTWMLLMLLISMLGLGAKRTYGSTLFRGLKLQKIPGNLARVTPRRQPPLDPEDTPNAHAQRPVAKKNTSGEHRIHGQPSRAQPHHGGPGTQPPTTHTPAESPKKRDTEKRRNGETDERAHHALPPNSNRRPLTTATTTAPTTRHRSLSQSTPNHSSRNSPGNRWPSDSSGAWSTPVSSSPQTPT